VQVVLGKGMRHARINWHAQDADTVCPTFIATCDDVHQNAHIEEALKRRLGYIRQHVTRTLNMKYSPTLTFKMSSLRAREIEMEALFASIRKDVA
jgi:ribosome-binding factor A